MAKVPAPHWPRLMTIERAAAYCDMSAPTFKAVCPVKPIALRDRLKRYDRHALDEWLDRLTGHGVALSAKPWLDRFD